MIVLNEHEWARDMILARDLGKKPFETLSRVARYYIDNEYPKKKVRTLLDAFLIQCDPTASIPKWSLTLDRALERASKNQAVMIDHIEISEPEMRIIDALQGRQLKRLACTLLCLAKYWDTVNHTSGHWVNTKDSDIMRMANINTSIKRQSQMYHTLNELGMVRFSRKVDNTNVQVTFIQKGIPAMLVSDFRNIGYQYLMHHGESYFICKNCGIVTKYRNPSRGKKQVYCNECAAEVAMQQRVNSVMRKRAAVQ